MKKRWNSCSESFFSQWKKTFISWKTFYHDPKSVSLFKLFASTFQHIWPNQFYLQACYTTCSSPERPLCILGVFSTSPPPSSSACSASSSSSSGSASCSSSVFGRKETQRHEYSFRSHKNLHWWDTKCVTMCGHVLPSSACSLERWGKHNYQLTSKSTHLQWNKQVISCEGCWSTHSYSSSTSDMAAIKRNPSGEQNWRNEILI